MSDIILNSTRYNGDPSLTANAGDWVDGEIVFNQPPINVDSSPDNVLTYSLTTANIYQIVLPNYDWAVNGWQIGDNCRGEYTLSVGVVGQPNYTQPESISFTILNIIGDTINVTQIVQSGAASYPIPSAVSFPGTHVSSSPAYPYDWMYESITITGENVTQQIDLEFNLARDQTTNLNSLIDGEVNKFYVNTVGLPLLGTVPMIQTNNQSGGLMKGVTVTKQVVYTNKTVEWSIKFKFLQWALIQDGFSEPNYYVATDDVAPYGRIYTWGNLNDPNTRRELLTTEDSTKVLANTGAFDENYNGKPNHFTVDSTSWFDTNGNPIQSLDYSGTSKFEAIVTSPNTSNLGSIYRIGLIWRPEDSSYYKNKLTNLGENLLLNAPEVDFLHSVTPDTTIYSGMSDPTGAAWDLTDIQFEHFGINQVKITGTVIPNGDANTLFSGVPNGGRTSTLWISIADPATLIQGTDRVSLKLWNEDNYDAPTLGVQIPNIVDEFLYDHDGNDITSNQTPNTTTEDDVLYEMNVLLPNNVAYNGMRFKIEMFNVQTGDKFDLENRYLSFGNVITQNGVMQLNEVANRNFNLPPTSDRNIWSVVLNPALDTSTHYGVTVSYGFLNDWLYWESLTNVNVDFYSLTDPNNGENKDWQHYDVTDWFPRVAIFTDLSGIEDFNYLEYNIRPYEDDVDVTATTVLTLLSTGAIITALLPNEIIEIETTFNWNQNFADEWVEFTIEDKEGGNRWVMSSVLDQGGVSANPLEPITGFTKIEVVGTGSNTLVATVQVDTSIITANDVSLSFRTYSSPNENDPSIVGKQKTDGTLKEKTDNTVKQKA
jgi:hypothetical protein